VKPKVLLIDDDSCHIRVASRYFVKTGWSVMRAGNGKEGLELALREIPDFVIVDYSMPLMNGHDFTVEFHAARKTRDVPVLMLSGREIPPEVTLLLKNDAAFIGFLPKPASFHEIEKRIHAALPGRRRHVAAGRENL
jgi:DNA-binding response OmpR family regulator